MRERGCEECAGIGEAGEERGRGRGEISSRGVVGREGETEREARVRLKEMRFNMSVIQRARRIFF